MANIASKFRISTIATSPDWGTVLKMVFGDSEHSMSRTNGNIGEFGFEGVVTPSPFFAGIVERWDSVNQKWETISN